MKDDNLIIAAFMQHEEGYDEHGKWQPLQYDTSWDWLMPVVEKINDLYDKKFPVDFVTKLLAKEPNGTKPYIDVIALPVSTPIKEVYDAVVEFIKWYNQNKQS